VFTFGKPPVSIDILTAVKGLRFEDCFELAEWFAIAENLDVRALSLSDLVAAKHAAGRPKDLDDLQNLDKSK
jgi:hypothetical protein